jgi:hypothetical protein
MDDNSLSKGNISDDIFAAQRIAAPGARRQKIIDTFDDDGVFTEPDKFLDGLHSRFQTGFFPPFRVKFVESFGTQELCENVSGKCLSVSDRRQQIFRPPQTILVGDPLHFDIVV